MKKALEAAWQRLSRVTEDDPLSDRHLDPTDALRHALQFVGIACPDTPPRAAQTATEAGFQAALRHLALTAKFRYRQIRLAGAWWREEGPPLLVYHRQMRQPLAAVCHRRRYWLQAPDTDALTPLSQEEAAQLSPSAFQLYPGFHGKLSGSAIARFSLQGLRGEIVSLIAAAALIMFLSLIVPVATGVVVSTAIPAGHHDLLAEMAVLVAAGAFAVFAIGAVRAFLAIRIETMANMRLQSAIWDRLLRLPARFFRGYSSGDLVRRVLAVDEARRLLTGPVLNGILSGLFSVFSFGLMLFYDLRLALFGLVFSAAVLAVLLGFALLQVRHLRRYRRAQGHTTSHVLGMLQGIDTLRLAAAEERAFLQWSAPFAQQQRALWRFGGLRAAQATFLTLVGPLGLLGAILLASWRPEPLELAAFAAFNAALGQFLAAITSFGLALTAVVSAIPLIDRARPLLAARPENQTGRADPGALDGSFALERVSFRYAETGSAVLNQISFRVEPGEFVALVGASGSGKSTILRLLLGFETPGSGRVLYGDKPLQQLDIRLVRQQIGTVLQSVGLLPGSLYENIAGARPVTEERVMAAAHKAAFDGDIAAFPMGLDTFVTEDGRTLSGGQRQRLMIARALVGDPAILFLDEATSALDNRTQSQVQDSIDRLKITRLVIAHRLSTIRNADRILVLKDGNLVECGDYDQLMAEKGEFFRLAKQQLI